MAMKFEGQSPPWLDNASQVILAQSQFHYACYVGDGHMLDILIGRALLQNNNDGDAMEACVGVLLSEEDAINGWPPAHWAAYYGQLTCLMKLHVRPHLGFDTPSNRCNVSPLHLAAKSGAVLCLKWLLQCGASKNRQDFMGETPLHKAAKAGNSDCASMLVGHGASLCMKNCRGLTPVDVAEQSNHTALAQYLRRAMEQADYGSITQYSQSQPFQEMPIADLNSHLIPNRSMSGALGNGSSLIFMNGEGIHNSSLAATKQGMDCDMETEDSTVALNENNNCTSVIKILGKRSFDDDEEFDHFQKRRCTVPSFKKDPVDRYGDSLNNSVLSSYNAVLAMQVEPVSNPTYGAALSRNFPKHNAPTHLSESSMIEHHATVVAQQGYDSTFMSSISNAFH